MYYTYPCMLERIPRQYVKYKVKFDFSVSFRFSVETKNNRVLTDFPLHSSLLHIVVSICLILITANSKKVVRQKP